MYNFKTFKKPYLLNFLRGRHVLLSRGFVTLCWFLVWVGERQPVPRALSSLSMDLNVSLREYLDRKMERIMRRNLDLGAAQFSIATHSSSVSKELPWRAQLKFLLTKVWGGGGFLSGLVRVLSWPQVKPRTLWCPDQEGSPSFLLSACGRCGQPTWLTCA